MNETRLIVFGGLPGTGKTTLAQAVATHYAAIYLRVDTIEQALRRSGCLAEDVGPAGYLVAYALAESNLQLGCSVVADSVNPLALTRDAWSRVASTNSAAVVEIEVTCSDEAEHRHRIETRSVDVVGLVLPTWQDVLDRAYEPWTRSRVVVDTAGRGISATLAELFPQIDRFPSPAIPSPHGSADCLPCPDRHAQ